MASEKDKIDKLNEQIKAKLPVLYYEEPQPGEAVNPFPYIEVQKDEDFPAVLFIHEYRHTGEFEPDGLGNEAAVVDMLLHKFVDMEVLKQKLDPETNDIVRVALGMKPLADAQREGAKILERVAHNVKERNDRKANK